MPLGRKRRFGGPIWLKMLLAILLAYLAVVALAFAFQNKLIFPGAGRIEPILPAGTERLAIETADGAHLAGLHIPPDAPAAAAPVILSFAGNGTNAASAAILVHHLYPRADVIGFHYRGYPPSGGRTSIASLRADALLEHDLAARRFPGRPIVGIGFSIGSGIAAWVAHGRPLAGLILVTPFDSLEKVAADRTPWLPVAWLMRGNLDSAHWLGGRGLPVAIVAGGSDRLVLPARTDALRSAIPNLVFDRTIRGAGHESIYGDAAFAPAMAEALAAIGGHGGAQAVGPKAQPHLPSRRDGPSGR